MNLLQFAKIFSLQNFVSYSIYQLFGSIKYHASDQHWAHSLTFNNTVLIDAGLTAKNSLDTHYAELVHIKSEWFKQKICATDELPKNSKTYYTDFNFCLYSSTCHILLWVYI